MEEYRYEIKSILPIENSSLFQTQIKSHGLGFKTAYPDRKINNVYFDTLKLSAYEENIEGVSSRTKTRYRWYGDLCNYEKGTLELKIKRNNLGKKALYKVEGVDLNSNWRTVTNTIKNQLPDEGKIHFSFNSQPALINTYERSYFVSCDGHIRVTLDRNIRFLNQFKSHLPNLKFYENAPPFLVVEVKCSPEHQKEALRIIDSMSSRTSRMSKYITGVRTMLE